MAQETPCQTDDAVYEIEIEPYYVSIKVELPFNITALSDDDQETLKSNMHNVMELVLSRYFSDPSINNQVKCTDCGHRDKKHDYVPALAMRGFCQVFDNGLPCMCDGFR